MRHVGHTSADSAAKPGRPCACLVGDTVASTLTMLPLCNCFRRPTHVLLGCRGSAYRTTKKYEMNIQINDDFALGADQYSWHILKRNKRKRNGKSVEEWEAVKWYTTLENAITGFADFKLRVSDAKTLVMVLKEQEKLKEELCRGLHTQFKGAA